MGTDSIIFSCQIYSFKNNIKNEKYKKGGVFARKQVEMSPVFS